MDWISSISTCQHVALKISKGWCGPRSPVNLPILSSTSNIWASLHINWVPFWFGQHVCFSGIDRIEWENHTFSQGKCWCHGGFHPGLLLFMMLFMSSAYPTGKPTWQRKIQIRSEHSSVKWSKASGRFPSAPISPTKMGAFEKKILAKNLSHPKFRWDFPWNQPSSWAKTPLSGTWGWRARSGRYSLSEKSGQTVHLKNRGPILDLCGTVVDGSG